MYAAGDPWEEVRGQVFFEKFNARRAFIMGAQLATTFGNTDRANTLTVRLLALHAPVVDVAVCASHGQNEAM